MNKRICVVGAGRWGKNHIKTFDGLGCLAGIVESDENVLADLAEKYPYTKTFSNIRDAVDAGFDGFTVATPAETHYEIALYIIEHGHHVLVEKPIALNSKDTAKLKALAEEKNVHLMVGHVLLFHPAIRKIKELIDSGKVGKLEYIYSNRLNLGTVRTEENILWSFAPHDFSIFQYFIEDMPIEISSQGGAFLQAHIHDTTMTTLRYPNNIVGHIFVSWLHPFKEHRFVIIGSKGMLSYEDSSELKSILFYEKGIDWVQGEPIKRDGPTENIAYTRSMPLSEELSYFVDHLDKDTIEIANAQNALEVLQMLEKASESLLSGGATTKIEEKESDKGFFVHESSYVDKNVEIGEGTKIWHYSHIQSNSKIGKGVKIGQNVNVANNVKIGNYCKLQNNVSVYEGVTLDDYVFCGPSMVFTNILDPRSKYPQVGGTFYHKTHVGEGASIGANATIICGNNLGRHCFIGAGAVVTKDVPEFALMVGNPARRVGWICECGEVLPKFDKDVTCPRCNRKYKLENRNKLTQLE